MERRHIQCDRDKCTGCLICEFACSAAKEGRFDLELSRIRVLQATPTLMDVVACRFCRNTPCIKACPFGAIAFDESTKTVVMCDLCFDQAQPQCIEFCPQKALSLHVSTKGKD